MKYAPSLLRFWPAVLVALSLSTQAGASTPRASAPGASALDASETSASTVATSASAASAPSASALGGSTADVDFAEYGKAFLKSHCKSAKPAECSLQEVRDQSYVHGIIGAFDIAYPAAFLSEKDRAEELRTIATGLLDLQSHWIDWLSKGQPTAATAKADIVELKAWVKGWKPSAFSKAASAPNKDILVLAASNDAQKAAAKRLTTFMTDPASMGVGPKDSNPVSILFSPTRHDFVELLGYAGLIDETQQGVLWNKNATTWGLFWIGQTMALGLTYPPWGDDPEFKFDLSMNKYEATGMLQCVVQQTANALLWACYGETDALYLNTAMGLNMAIAVCGEVNALEGDSSRGTTGAHTDPYEKFVPGGNSAGGTLPAIPAAPMDMMKVNQWRASLGRDHFAGPLRKGQKASLKELGKGKGPKLEPSLAKDKIAHFLLIGTDVSQKYVVSAPFLGSHAKEKPYPPPDVIVDYKEFFRAYKSCFYNWLQTMGDPKGAEPSAQKYADLLKALATRAADKPFDQVVMEIYAVPLSDKNGEVDSLEWRFLKWLDKGK